MAVLGTSSLTGCSSIPSFIAGGSLMLFQQTAAPTSWTKQTTHNNKALRVVSGTAGSGGSTAFTSVFTSRTPSGSNSGGSVSFHTLSQAQLPSHNHGYLNLVNGSFNGSNQDLSSGNNGSNTNRSTGNRGSNGSHNHGFTNPTFSGTAMNFAVQYVDLIICRKN